MSLDNTGAPAPSSRYAKRLARLKIIRRKANAEQRKRRRWLKNQVLMSNILLESIIAGADLVGNVTLVEELDDGNSYPIPSVRLLVTLSAIRFTQLCEYGADLEDLEDTNDAEPTDADRGEVDDFPQPSLIPATGADLIGWDSCYVDLEADGELAGSGCQVD